MKVKERFFKPVLEVLDGPCHGIDNFSRCSTNFLSRLRNKSSHGETANLCGRGPGRGFIYVRRGSHGYLILSPDGVGGEDQSGLGARLSTSLLSEPLENLVVYSAEIFKHSEVFSVRTQSTEKWPCCEILPIFSLFSFCGVSYRNIKYVAVTNLDLIVCATFVVCLLTKLRSSSLSMFC